MNRKIEWDGSSANMPTEEECFVPVLWVGGCQFHNIYAYVVSCKVKSQGKKNNLHGHIRTLQVTYVYKGNILYVLDEGGI